METWEWVVLAIFFVLVIVALIVFGPKTKSKTVGSGDVSRSVRRCRPGELSTTKLGWAQDGRHVRIMLESLGIRKETFSNGAELYDTITIKGMSFTAKYVHGLLIELKTLQQIKEGSVLEFLVDSQSIRLSLVNWR